MSETANEKKILLNDILNFEDLSKVKIRFNLMFGGNWSPSEIFKNGDIETLLCGHYSNYEPKENGKLIKNFKPGQITVGFIRLSKDDDLWLLFHIGKVTKDLNKSGCDAYEFEELLEYSKYFGRLIIRFKNSSQTMVRTAESVIDECEVVKILPNIFTEDNFPGYDNVNVSWNDLSRILKNESWKTALENQKGVYLITDSSNGKMYVGSAYGENMIFGRWKEYEKNGHGGNSELKNLSFEHIKEYFRYSILEIFKSTTADDTIIERESWWKEILQTRKFGYNKN